MDIKLPSRLTLDMAIPFLEDLSGNIFEDIVFDCSPLSHVEPFTMLLVASGIDQHIRQNSYLNILFRGPFLQYPRFMGFFHFSGHRLSPPPNYKMGNPRYSQIKKLSCHDIRSKSIENYSEVGDEIELDSRALAVVLSRGTEPLLSVLSYSIREIIRNVLDHSKSDHFYYCAQYWPTLDKVEIAVLDCGIGLRESLSRNPGLKVTDDITAINLALTPEVSGVKYSGQPRARWYNSGYGLYMVSRICEAGGSFTIMSGSAGLTKSKNSKEFFKCSLGGTGVRLVLKPSQIIDVQKSLNQFKEDAAQIIKANDGKPTGESPSTVLRTFKR